MGMYTHVMLNVPLINDKKDGAKFIEDNQEAVRKNTGHGVHGLPWHIAQALLYQSDDNVFLNESKIRYSEYGKNDPKMNRIVLLTMILKRDLEREFYHVKNSKRCFGKTNQLRAD